MNEKKTGPKCTKTNEMVTLSFAIGSEKQSMSISPLFWVGLVIFYTLSHSYVYIYKLIYTSTYIHISICMNRYINEQIYQRGIQA